MCYLTTVVGSFHGRVLAARLGAEGVIVVLKGTTDGPYPIQSTVDVLVPADQLKLAREILLADAVDDVFGSLDLADGGGPGEGSTSGADEESLDGRARALIPLWSGGPADSFSLRPAAGSGPLRLRSRLHGLPAVLIVVVVTVMIVGVFFAAAVR